MCTLLGWHKSIVEQSLFWSRQILCPASGPGIDMRSAHCVPLDLSLDTSQKELEFACATAPTRRLVRCPNNCCAAGISVSNRCVAHGARSTSDDASISLNRQGQAPDCSCRIAKQAQAISGPRLVGSGVVSCSDQRSELRFELSQRDVWRAVSFLMSGACREHKSDAYQITSWCKRR